MVTMVDYHTLTQGILDLTDFVIQEKFSIAENVRELTDNDEASGRAPADVCECA